MTAVTVDFETYYDDEFSLKNLTPAEFILDQRFEPYGAGVKVDDEPAIWYTPLQLTSLLMQPEILGATFISHNALFDMCVLAWRFGFVPRRMVDTLGMSRALLGYKLRSNAL